MCTYRLVPVGVCVGNQVTEGVHGLVLFRGGVALDAVGVGNGSVGLNLDWLRCGLGLWLGLAVEGADHELLLVLLQDGLVVILPELLGSVLSGNTLEDCCMSVAISFFIVYPLLSLTLLSTRVLIGELGDIVDILVNDDVQVLGLVVGGHIGHGESLRHGVCDVKEV